MLTKLNGLIVRILPFLFALPANGDVLPTIEIAKSFYRDIIHQRQLNAVDRIIAKNYIQHSPNVQDGQEGVRKALEFLATLPKSAKDSPSPVLRAIGENDLVVLHLKITFGGNELSVIDLFRVSGN